MQLCARAPALYFRRTSGQRGAEERYREAAEVLEFQETPLCQSISGWQGSREDGPHITAQQAVTCACTTIYTVIRT